MISFEYFMLHLIYLFKQKNVYLTTHLFDYIITLFYLAIWSNWAATWCSNNIIYLYLFVVVWARACMCPVLAETIDNTLPVYLCLCVLSHSQLISACLYIYFLFGKFANIRLDYKINLFNICRPHCKKNKQILPKKLERMSELESGKETQQ
jgi:hypothetical protein